MRFILLSLGFGIFGVVTFICPPAKSHIVGTEKWCLAFSPFHQECVYKTEDQCLKDILKPATLSVQNEERPLPKDSKASCFENPMPGKNSFFSP